VEIVYLGDHPEWVNVLARWHHQQWSYLDPHLSMQERAAFLARHASRPQIPVTFVALSGKTLLGSASLVARDMDIRAHLSPWLASVFVAPDQRRRGIGSALVARVVQEARVLDVGQLYLFTPDKEAFYARRGWTVLEQVEYRGVQVTVMTHPIHYNRSNDFSRQ
jgi:GNAT superfamily N-acetyltransferase